MRLLHTWTRRAFARLRFPTLATPLIAFVLAGCTSIPKGIEPVQGLELDRYLGTWYEIARLDHSFERGLSNVTATYTKRDGGGIVVTNRGFSNEKQEWNTAVGKAFPVGDSDTGHLKVSFFGPFYGSYVIFELDGLEAQDGEYQAAFVTGPSRKFLWFLAREPEVSDEVKGRFLQRMEELGFELGELVWVEHGG